MSTPAPRLSASAASPAAAPLRVAIVGAAGYTGERLVRLLLRHPAVELAVVTSRKHAGKRVADILPALGGIAGDLAFSDPGPDGLAARSDLTAVFLALPHGVAAEYARPLVAAGIRVLDLSADFRISDPARYEAFYGHPHPAPDLLPQARYVIPELAEPGWEDCRLIASPGCYPTSILVPLLPLVRAGLLDGHGIVIASSSGISGAGRRSEEFYSFVERAHSVTAYGIPRHRHLAEIEEQLGRAAGHAVVAQFIPHLVPLVQGIHTTIVAPGRGATADAVRACWAAAFAGCPCVGIRPAGSSADTASVIHTNRVEIAAFADPRTGNLVLTSAVDNLVKGAGGQAIQSFNRLHGLPETAGLP